MNSEVKSKLNKYKEDGRIIVPLRNNILGKNADDIIKCSINGLSKKQLEKKCYEDEVYRYVLYNVSKSNKNVGTKEAITEYLTMNRSNSFYKETGIMSSPDILGVIVLKEMEEKKFINELELAKGYFSKSNENIENIFIKSPTNNNGLSKDEIKDFNKLMDNVTLKGDKTSMISILNTINKKKFQYISEEG